MNSQGSVTVITELDKVCMRVVFPTEVMVFDKRSEDCLPGIEEVITTGSEVMSVAPTTTVSKQVE